MDIDLSKVIGYSKDSLQSRALMRSIMLDLYPGKTREMNILLDVYESGIPRTCKSKKDISSQEYEQYIQIIIDNYGLQREFAAEGLNAWLEYCIPGIEFKKIEKNETNNILENHNIEHKKKDNVQTNVGTSVTSSGTTSDYLLKDLSDGSVEIQKFLGFDTKKLIVPSYIAEKKVTVIGKEAYKACSEIQELIISEGIRLIDDGAFTNCENLSKVSFPKSLERIGTGQDKKINGAFENTAIIDLVIPDNVTYISQSTFMRCHRLERVILSSKLTKISDFMFRACDKLSTVHMSDSVKAIGRRAFSGCVLLSEIDMPNQLKLIEEEAFDRCKSIKHIVLPNGVSEVKSKAFIECRALETFVCNDGLHTIGNNVFENCTSLKKILLSKSLTSIGDKIFYLACKDLDVYVFGGSKAVEWARSQNCNIKNADSFTL